MADVPAGAQAVALAATDRAPADRRVVLALVRAEDLPDAPPVDRPVRAAGFLQA